MTDRRIILGIGNIGRDYVGTRHNCGFFVVETLARRTGCAFSTRKWEADLAEPAPGWSPSRVLLLKPRTLVNCSGRVAQAALAFFKLPPEALLVVVDDLNLPLGDLRLRGEGSHGGHNGLRDIERCLGRGYARLRLGIGDSRRQGRQDQVSFVLGRFATEEHADAQAMFEKAADCCETWLRDGLDAAQRFNGPLRPPPPKAKPVVEERPRSGHDDSQSPAGADV